MTFLHPGFRRLRRRPRNARCSTSRSSPPRSSCSPRSPNRLPGARPGAVLPADKSLWVAVISASWWGSGVHRASCWDYRSRGRSSCCSEPWLRGPSRPVSCRRAGVASALSLGLRRVFRVGNRHVDPRSRTGALGIRQRAALGRLSGAWRWMMDPANSAFADIQAITGFHLVMVALFPGSSLRARSCRSPIRCMSRRSSWSSWVADRRRHCSRRRGPCSHVPDVRGPGSAGPAAVSHRWMVASVLGLGLLFLGFLMKVPLGDVADTGDARAVLERLQRGWWFDPVWLMLLALAFVLYSTGVVATRQASTSMSVIAYNALTIARWSRRARRGLAPVLPDLYRLGAVNPVYVYGLAAVFKVFGPSILAARLFSAVAGFVAAVLLVWRRSGPGNRRVIWVVAVSAFSRPGCSRSAGWSSRSPSSR